MKIAGRYRAAGPAEPALLTVSILAGCRNRVQHFARPDAGNDSGAKVSMDGVRGGFGVVFQRMPLLCFGIDTLLAMQ
jgi:hypothetical protein